MILAASLLSAFIGAMPEAMAAILIDGTRVVYPANRREVTISVRNSGDSPSLVQAWLDAGDVDSRPDETAVPFVLTPPLFRLDPTRSQSLRMVYTRDPLPADRESLFWLNVLDVPPRAAKNPDLPNQLELAFKHRMKVFFRPTGLKGSAAEAPAQVSWKLVTKDGQLTGVLANNPTAYHISLVRVALAVNGAPVVVKSEMLAPFSSSTFPLPDPVPAPAAAVAVDYTFVNDYGGNVGAAASASAQ